jgi:hypothetical protein
MSADDDSALFEYSLDIGGREFLIEFRHDGTSCWDDHTFRRAQRPEGRKFLEAEILFGNSEEAAHELSEEKKRFTVEYKLPDGTMSWIEVAADMFGSDNWTIEHERRLDEILVPIFWDHINPKLESALSPEAT